MISTTPIGSLVLVIVAIRWLLLGANVTLLSQSADVAILFQLLALSLGGLDSF